jgi:hypothetical protein
MTSTCTTPGFWLAQGDMQSGAGILQRISCAQILSVLSWSGLHVPVTGVVGHEFEERPALRCTKKAGEE